MSVNDSTKLEQDLEWNVINHAARYGISIIDAPTLKSKFTALIERLAQKNRVVILIDEYDYPLINNIKNLGIAEQCRQVLHDFFVILKDLNKYIRFIFITGVTKFSKTSIFSGLNNLNDITFHQKASLVCGYTQDEIIDNFDAYLKEFAAQEKVEQGEILYQMRTWYNGYQFVEAQTLEKKEKLKVYNPFLVLLSCDNYKILNYWASTGTPAFVAHLNYYTKLSNRRN